MIKQTKNLITGDAGTVNLLEKIRKSDIQLKRFVFISSSSVFGDIKYLPIDEMHLKNPISPYGVNKLAAEHYVNNYNLHYGIPTVIIRPFTVIGARQRPDMALHRFIETIINGKPLVIYGDGTQTRDWTHIGNICDGILLSAEKKAAIGESFNIGSGIRTNINEVLEKINNYLIKDYKIIYKPKNIADPQDTQANIKKASKLLGYQPEKTLDNAIMDQIEFFVNHKNLFS